MTCMESQDPSAEIHMNIRWQGLKEIILAAGRGSRMGALTNHLPKCRTIFQGKELIQWQLDSLKRAGIGEIAIVRGYLADTFDLGVS